MTNATKNTITDDELARIKSVAGYVYTARQNILALIERNEHWIEDLEEANERTAEDVAKRILKGWANPEEALRSAQHAIDDNKARIAERRGILTGLRTALEINDAASGKFSYAYRGSYYGDTAYKFQTTEERDAWLEAKEWSSYRAATPEDLEKILSGEATVETTEA